MTVTRWIHFLADKKIAEHLAYDCIRTRLKNRKRSGHSIRQCLGIDKARRRSAPKNKTPIVSAKEMPVYLHVNAFLRKRLVNNAN